MIEGNGLSLYRHGFHHQRGFPRSVLSAADGLAIAVVTVIFSFTSTAAGDMGLQEIAQKVRPAVVLLTIYDSGGDRVGAGTGFFVSADGLVVTNHHVIKDASRVNATLVGKRTVDATGVVATDRSHDIAVIRLPGDGYPALSLGSSRHLSQGTDVVVIGSPLGFSGTLSSGIVSAIRKGGIPDTPLARADRSHPVIQITAAISPGSSGSPVLTRDGSVVGVAVSTYMSGQALNFAVPVEAVAAVLDTIDPGTPARPFTRTPLRNLIISLVFFAALGGGIGLYLLHRRRRQRRHVPPNASSRSSWRH